MLYGMNLLCVVGVVLWCSTVFGLPTSRDTCDCVCGVRGRGNRIVGGTATKPNEYPWVVGLWRMDLGRIYCGAAVISNKHIITAAHCVNNFERTEMRVYLGGHNVSSDYTEIRRVKEIHQHEYFDIVSFDNDIAILELDRPVKFGPKVQPACLPDTQFDDYTDKLAMITGWGRTGEKDGTSKGLRSVIVPIWSQEHCGESGYGKTRLTGNMMCAGYPEGMKDACQGDSGGPMHYEGKTGSMEVIGVVSWGRGCARPNLPGIYTRVSNYLPWIQKKLNGQCMCKPKTGERTNFMEKIVNNGNNIDSIVIDVN